MRGTTSVEAPGPVVPHGSTFIETPRGGAPPPTPSQTVASPQVPRWGARSPALGPRARDLLEVWRWSAIGGGRISCGYNRRSPEPTRGPPARGPGGSHEFRWRATLMEPPPLGVVGCRARPQATMVRRQPRTARASAAAERAMGGSAASTGPLIVCTWDPLGGHRDPRWLITVTFGRLGPRRTLIGDGARPAPAREGRIHRRVRDAAQFAGERSPD